MANSAFFTEMGNMGSEILAELAPELGIEFNYTHRADSPVTLTGFLGGTAITSEILARIMTAGERFTLIVGTQTSFPPADGIAEFDQIGWTPPDIGEELQFTIESFRKMGSFGTIFSLTCYYPEARQAGNVG